MTLRKKTLIIVGATLFSLIVILYIISRTILLESFTKLEEKITQQNVERVLDSLSANLSTLNSKTGDWASWDETYAFIENTDYNFIKRNLTDNAFIELKLNIMLYVHSSGHLVFGKAFDLQNKKEIPIPQSLQKHISANRLLLKHPNIQSSLTGIINLPEGPMLIASRPILTSEGKGTIRGTLIFGRYLDIAEIQHLAETTNFALTLHRLDESHMPFDFQLVRSYLSEQIPIFIRPLNEQTVSGYTILKDVYGKPDLMLRVDMHRDIYKQGIDSIYYFIFSALAIGMVLGIVTLILLERQVLSRLTCLITNVSSIGASGNLSIRVPITGKDEISLLSEEMNRMLETIEKSDKALRDSEEKYRTLVENINIGVYRNTSGPKGRFLHSNTAIAKMFGYDSVEEFMNVYVSELYQDSKERQLFLEKIQKKGFVNSEELKLRKKDGSLIWGSVTARVHYDTNGEIEWIDGVIEDITKRKRLEEELRALSLRDELTDLYNRRGFVTLAEQQLKIANRVKKEMLMIFIDLDDLKQINDTIGHQEGDRALIDIAQILRKTFRESDIIARYGGDEFVILSLKPPEFGVDMLINRLREQLNYHNRYENRQYRLSLSMGFARFDPENPLPLHELLVKADNMMYEQKKAGRDSKV